MWAGRGGYFRSYIHVTRYNMREKNKRKEKERGRLTKRQ